MRKIVTLDIGGTNIKVGIFEDEVLVQEAEIPTLAKAQKMSLTAVLHSSSNICRVMASVLAPVDKSITMMVLSTTQTKTCQVIQACK